MIGEILNDLARGKSVGIIAAKFHNTLAEIVVAVAKQIHEEKIVLTGGCFQNRYHHRTNHQPLDRRGFRPYWHQRIPPNDGGIALGQLVAAARHHQRAALLRERWSRMNLLYGDIVKVFRKMELRMGKSPSCRRDEKHSARATDGRPTR